MAEDGLKNPYESGDDGQQVLLSRRFALLFSVFLLVLILVAPVARHLWQVTLQENERWLPLVAFFHHPNPDAEELLKNKQRGNPGIRRTEPSLRDHLESLRARLVARRLRVLSFTRSLMEGRSRGKSQFSHDMQFFE